MASMEKLIIPFSQKHLKLMRLVVIIAALNVGLQAVLWMVEKKPSSLTHLNVTMWAVAAALALMMYLRQRDTAAITLSSEDVTYQQGAFSRSIPLQNITAITHDAKHLIIAGDGGQVIKKLKSSMYQDPDRLVAAFTAMRAAAKA